MKLTAKEQRLYEYLVSCIEEGTFPPTIGDICRNCRTTPKTLLDRTLPNLERKIRRFWSSKKIHKI